MGISQLSPSFHSFVDVCNHRHSDFIILKIHRLFLRVICENLHEQTPDSSRDDKSQLEVMERRCLLQKQKYWLRQERVRKHLLCLFFLSIICISALLDQETVFSCSSQKNGETKGQQVNLQNIFIG